MDGKMETSGTENQAKLENETETGLDDWDILGTVTKSVWAIIPTHSPQSQKDLIVRLFFYRALKCMPGPAAAAPRVQSAHPPAIVEASLGLDCTH